MKDLKNILLFSVCLVVLVSCSEGTGSEVTLPAPSPDFKPFISLPAATRRADSLVRLMTLAEKIRYVKGYKEFFIRPVPRLNIPLIYLSDATQGVHIRHELDSSIFQQMERATAFPSALSLAASWNLALVDDYARAVGEECRAGGIHILLGPGLSFYRSSQYGRSYEYLGEDPYLVSSVIERYVVSLQNTGVMATLKAFVANNSDFYRRRSNSVVSERALHEIYTKGFKAGIDAGALAVMTSYNLVNGEWAGQSDYVINDLLREQLGFRHLVMTDWWSVWDTEKIVHSGLDLIMPRGEFFTGVEELIAAGKIRETQLDRMVGSIIRSCIMMGFYDRPQQDSTYLETFPSHVEIALNTAREGIVLLKNDRSLLPITGSKDILLTGKFVDTLAIPSGSADVDGYDWLDLPTAIQNEFGDRIMIKSEPTDEDIRSASLVILSTGNLGLEGADIPYKILPGDDAFAERVCSLNPNTIVVVNASAGINMMRWADKAGALVYAWYPGQIGNRALAEVLSGKINPSGKLPITIEKTFQDSPAYGYLPAGETPRHGKLKWDLERPIHDVVYKEGVFVGYRWYEKEGIEPLFPFGHGLSYTQFDYGNLKVSPDGQDLRINFRLENLGDRAGAEIVQVYARDVECSVPRPIKELKGFKKISLTEGEIADVAFTLSTEDLSFWHPGHRRWYFEPGEFEILIGASSQDIRLSQKITLNP